MKKRTILKYVLIGAVMGIINTIWAVLMVYSPIASPLKTILTVLFAIPVGIILGIIAIIVERNDKDNVQ